MAQQMRFWFKTSELYLQGPFTMAGVLASSWEEATERLMSHPETKKLFCIAPEFYFLSANAIQMIRVPEGPEHEHWNCPVVVQLPKPVKASKRTRKAA
jgi:hypothetical protein